RPRTRIGILLLQEPDGIPCELLGRDRLPFLDRQSRERNQRPCLPVWRADTAADRQRLLSEPRRRGQVSFVRAHERQRVQHRNRRVLLIDVPADPQGLVQGRVCPGQLRV